MNPPVPDNEYPVDGSERRVDAGAFGPEFPVVMDFRHGMFHVNPSVRPSGLERVRALPDRARASETRLLFVVPPDASSGIICFT
ncbi:MAG TPA: hypothetical protein PKE13_10525 [Hyphomicrobium zavarzinii]|nr:hypothetical protein [Hyphomicrobium zavarzinii]